MKKFISMAVCAAIIGWAGLAAAGSTGPSCPIECQIETYFEAYTGEDNIVWFDKYNTSYTWIFNLDKDKLYSAWDGENYGAPVDIKASDRILSADLGISFFDDCDRKIKEYAKLKVDGDTYFKNKEIDTNDFFQYDVLSSVFDDHKLKVTVKRISGDFGVSYIGLGGTFVDGACPVPEPATMLLFASGLAGLAAVGRRKLTK
ncbi:MAG: PEP-CTERM sorting domain-containing protein [Chlorobium sp.]|nr:PEP-CTERM sorting domain-containing protein [Chlorobium sp.]